MNTVIILVILTIVSILLFLHVDHTINILRKNSLGWEVVRVLLTLLCCALTGASLVSFIIYS